MGLQNTTGIPHGRPSPLQGGQQASARDLRSLYGAVFGARGELPIKVKVGADGLVISFAGLSTWDLFGYRTKPGSQITIRKRSIRIHQVANVAVPEQDVHLGGSPCWVYAPVSRSTYAAAACLVSATEPVSDEGTLNVVLYSFALNTTTGRYTLDTAGKFDVNLGAG